MSLKSQIETDFFKYIIYPSYLHLNYLNEMFPFLNTWSASPENDVIGNENTPALKAVKNGCSAIKTPTDHLPLIR